MATGDVTISITVEGGTTKSAVFDSDTRVKAKARVAAGPIGLAWSDADWQIYTVNRFAQIIVTQANAKAAQDAIPTPKTFTAAS